MYCEPMLDVMMIMVFSDDLSELNNHRSISQENDARVVKFEFQEKNTDNNMRAATQIEPQLATRTAAAAASFECLIAGEMSGWM